jgi:hypothetical protein
MRTFLFAAVCTALLALALAGCRSPQTNSNNSAAKQANQPAAPQPGTKVPPENVVAAQAAEVELHPGSSVDVNVNLAIVEGYHVHANPATLKNLIATTLTVTTPAGIKADAPAYPAAQMMKFSFDETPLAVWAGTANIGLRLHADAKMPLGTQMIPAKLRYQACDDTACYPPKTIDVTIPVSVKPKS